MSSVASALVCSNTPPSALREAGLGQRMDRQGDEHSGVAFAWGHGRIRVDFREAVDRSVMVWAQTEVQADLYATMDQWGATILDEVEDVELHEVAGERPWVTFTRDSQIHRLDCDWIAGCDGAHGVSRLAIPDELRRTYERRYPFGWLGVLSKTPPVSDELVYASHERGFALCSMRRSRLSRYYVQCDANDDVANWSDDRFWV